MKLDTYKIALKLADMGMSMNAAGIDSRVIAKAKQGKETQPATVKKIADILGCRPEDITIREVNA